MLAETCATLFVGTRVTLHGARVNKAISSLSYVIAGQVEVRYKEAAGRVWVVRAGSEAFCGLLEKQMKPVLSVS